MPKIEIRFGNLVPSEFEEILNKRAIDWNCSFEFTFLESFRYLMENTLLKQKKGENYFDLAFLILSERRVRAPRANFDNYIANGFKLPMIVLSGDTLSLVDSKEKIYIDDELLERFGKEFEEHFEYEYVGFLRK
jgi:hypothetical protein